MNYEKIYVLDTNILLEDANNIFKLSQNGKNLIVLPETVLDEIDSKKSGFDEINFQARQFARILESYNITKSISEDEYKIVVLELDTKNKKSHIHIISKNDYSFNSKNMPLNVINDRKILEIAGFSKEYYKKEIEFISLDIMARTRAVSLDIKTTSLIGKNKDDFKYDFIRTIEIDFHDQENLQNQDIINFDKEYKAHYYSYCFKIKASDQVILAYIQNKKIKILDESEVRNQIITPLNKEQLFFSNAIISHFFNILIVEAKAGSGKTLLALSGALKLVRQKQYQKIIYIRNSVESLDKGEDIGYLPGFEEKFAIYNHPLMDSLDYIIRSEYKKKKANKQNAAQFANELDDSEVASRIEQLIANYSIQTMWVGEMRGRTISNAFEIGRAHV